MLNVGDEVEVFDYGTDKRHRWNGYVMKLTRYDAPLWYGTCDKWNGEFCMYAVNLRRIEKPEDYEFDV